MLTYRKTPDLEKNISPVVCIFDRPTPTTIPILMGHTDLIQPGKNRGTLKKQNEIFKHATASANSRWGPRQDSKSTGTESTNVGKHRFAHRSQATQSISSSGRFRENNAMKLKIFSAIHPIPQIRKKCLSNAFSSLVSSIHPRCSPF